MLRGDHTIVAISGSHMSVRMADEADGPMVSRLAALDSAAAPEGPTLIAEIDGEAVAALTISGAAAVADPFRPTAAALELLELRAAQIRAHGRVAAPPASRGERLRAFVRTPRSITLR